MGFLWYVSWPGIFWWSLKILTIVDWFYTRWYYLSDPNEIYCNSHIIANFGMDHHKRRNELVYYSDMARKSYLLTQCNLNIWLWFASAYPGDVHRSICELLRIMWYFPGFQIILDQWHIISSRLFEHFWGSISMRLYSISGTSALNEHHQGES